MNVSLSELVMVVVVALLVLKPEQLPEVAKMIGKATKMARQLFRKMKNEMTEWVDKANS